MLSFSVVLGLMQVSKNICAFCAALDTFILGDSNHADIPEIQMSNKFRSNA